MCWLILISMFKMTRVLLIEKDTFHGTAYMHALDYILGSENTDWRYGYEDAQSALKRSYDVYILGKMSDDSDVHLVIKLAEQIHRNDIPYKRILVITDDEILLKSVQTRGMQTRNRRELKSHINIDEILIKVIEKATK